MYKCIDVLRAQNESDTGLLSLAIVAIYYKVGVDTSQIRHNLGIPSGHFTTTDLLRAAKRLKFKARRVRYNKVFHLKRLPFPAIIKMKNGTFQVLAGVDGERCILCDPHKRALDQVSMTELKSVWSGCVLLLTPRAYHSEKMRRFSITWFISEIVRYRKLFADIFVASFFIQIFALVTPIFFQLVIDKVLVHHGMSTLHVLAVGLGCISLFEVMLSAVRTYIMIHTSSRIDVALSSRLFNHLMALPINYFEARQTGHSVARVRELENIREFLTGNTITLVLDLFFTIVFFAVMWIYSPTLTLIVLGMIPFYVGLAVIVTPVLRRRIEERFDRGAEKQTFLVESIFGVETLKASAVEPQMQRRWENLLAAYVTANFKAQNLHNFAGQFAQFINKVMIVGILWFGAQLVIDHQLTVGQLVAFNILAGRISGPILRIAQMWNEFQQFRISIDRLGDILNCPTEISTTLNRSDLKRIIGNISFQHVSFRYRLDGREILSNVTLEVAAGEIVGIVGPSGSGKSTLTKLLQRLYVPERGQVLLDGIDLAMVDPKWLRRHIGVVLQENVLFNRTVRENITLADPAIPFERVVGVAKLAGAHDFVLGLPFGYDTVVEERGANLSGGQRQRIAIARALVSDPRILIFDEATSALDYESEYLIQQNMKQITAGRTVFIVAHRLAAIRNATRIVAIEDGRIVEQGTHDELMANQGYYATLYEFQFGTDAAAD